MSTLAFIKVQGLGNDFLLLDRRRASVSEVDAELIQLSALAPAVCDRRRGVGADGILVMGPAVHPDSDASMVVVNFDGSRPEMCGNGLRCVALVAAGPGERTVHIDTDAGVRRCDVSAPDAMHGDVEVDMGPGTELGAQTPAVALGRTLHGVSMGNPHAIAFTGPDEDPRELAHRLGPAIETAHDHYPDGTNVEFCRVQGDTLVLWVWERGCGITDACGTGACATAVAAARQGLVPTDQDVTVRLPGGDLHIQVPAAPHAGVRMRGPATVVFQGTMDWSPTASGAAVGPPPARS